MKVDTKSIEAAVRQILVAIGEDPTRDGLEGTPGRVARLWKEFADYKPGKIKTSFAAQTIDQMVVVSGIEGWTYCEHHLLPFRVKVAIGYIPNGKILGLSKFGRIVHLVCHRLQVQERLTEEIANLVQAQTGSADVAVQVRGEHLCMTMRGIRTPSLMTTSVMWGRFRDNPVTRSEFKGLAALSA
jgi:GTP cyclohydrolase IA